MIVHDFRWKKLPKFSGCFIFLEARNIYYPKKICVDLICVWGVTLCLQTFFLCKTRLDDNFKRDLLNFRVSFANTLRAYSERDQNSEVLKSMRFLSYQLTMFFSSFSDLILIQKLSNHQKQCQMNLIGRYVEALKANGELDPNY